MRKRLAAFLVAISPDCRASVRLLSASGTAPSSMARRLGLRLHLVLCSFCRRYRRQTGRLQSAAPSAHLALMDAPLPADARRRIRDRLHAVRPPQGAAAGSADSCGGHQAP